MGTKNANPNGSHPMQRTMADRAAKRARFAKWLIHRLDLLEVPVSTRAQGRHAHTYRAPWLAERVGVGRATAQDWITGSTLPGLHQLPAIAAAVQADLAEVCYAAGRPPSDAVRHRFSTDPDGALATLVHQWRTGRGYTHEQAGAVLGLSGGTLTRFESGQRSDMSVPTLLVLADGFGMSPSELALACRAVRSCPESLDEAAQLASQPLPMRLRLARKGLGLTEAQVASAACAGAASVRNYELGKTVPSPRTLPRLARILQVPLAELLVLAGHATEAEAARAAQVVSDAARLRPRRSFGQAVRANREAADLRVYQLAEKVGTDRFVISRFENGHQRPATLARVIALADAMSAEPAPLVALWSRAA